MHKRVLEANPAFYVDAAGVSGSNSKVGILETEIKCKLEIPVMYWKGEICPEQVAGSREMRLDSSVYAYMSTDSINKVT